MSSESRPLSARIDRLFRAMHPRDEPEVSSVFVASKASAVSGMTVTSDLVDGLRDGTVTSADPQILKAIAKCFNAPENYLFDLDCSKFDAQLQVITSLRDARLNWFAFRGTGSIPTEQLEQVSDVLDRLADEDAGDGRSDAARLLDEDEDEDGS